MTAINIQLPKLLSINENIIFILSNDANLACFSLHGGDWQMHSGPVRVNVLPLKLFTH